jgi:putative membrane protein
MISTGHMSGGDGWMWLWGSMMVVFWIAVVCLAVWVVVRAMDTRDGGVS